MKKSQIKVFEELLQDESFRGKKQLKHLLWLNTAEQKFKIGDCFVVSDPGHYLYGCPVKNFKAKVVKVSAWIHTNEWYYELKMEVHCKGKKITANVCKYESELAKADRCEDNINEIKDAKSDCEESLDA